jgi:hypothetical protein
VLLLEAFGDVAVNTHDMADVLAEKVQLSHRSKILSQLLCASIHIALGVSIQLIGVHWLVRNLENMLLCLGANSCITMELFPERVTTWISLRGICDSEIAIFWSQNT